MSGRELMCWRLEAVYGATLMRWMGVPDSAIDLVFPNLAAFGSRNLGFLS